MNAQEEELVFVALEMMRAAKVIAANSPGEECIAIKALLAEAERQLESLNKE